MMPIGNFGGMEGLQKSMEKLQKQMDEIRKQAEKLRENPSNDEGVLGNFSDKIRDAELNKPENFDPDRPKHEEVDDELGDWAIEKDEINSSENSEVKVPSQNKLDGLARETEVEIELEEKYPEEEGYSIEAEVYLRDKDGNIVKDPLTGEARRIDFVVVKDGKVVDSIEVTSKTADKTEQTAKENRIRENGGNYIKDKDGNLIEIPADVQTRIERRD